jgi:hypothetical protein
MVRIPAITDFRAKGTIMGRAGLTAVFGMGTGVTPPVWSPEKSPAGIEAGLGTLLSEGGRTRSDKPFLLMSEHAPRHSVKKALRDGTPIDCWDLPLGFFRGQGGQRPDRGGQAAWLLGPVG